MTNTKKRAAMLLATGALMSGSFVGLSATSAEAVSCKGASVVQNNSSGYGYFKKKTPVRVFPYAKCAGKNFKKGTKFYYWCYDTNDYGNKWIWGRVAGTDYTGWVYAPNVPKKKGTLRHC